MDSYSKGNVVLGWFMACFSVFVLVKLGSRMSLAAAAWFAPCSIALTVFAIRLTSYRRVITKETNHLILTLMMGFVSIFVWIGAAFRR
jgi:hypothetical protein